MVFDEELLKTKIQSKGNEIRTLKAEPNDTSKALLQQSISELLDLKAHYKALTGNEYGQDQKKDEKTKKKKPTDADADVNADAQTHPPSQAGEEGNKTKKQLNKERKKSLKQAMKDDPHTSLESNSEQEILSVKQVKKVDPKLVNQRSNVNEKGTKKSSLDGLVSIEKLRALAFSTNTPYEAKQSEHGEETEGVKDVKDVKDVAHTSNTDFKILFSSRSLLRVPMVSFMVAKYLELEKKHDFFLRMESPERPIVPVLIFKENKKQLISGDFAIARFLVRSFGANGALYDGSMGPESVSQIDSWLDLILTSILNNQTASTDEIEKVYSILNTFLSDRTYLVGYGLTLADIGLVCALKQINASHMMTNLQKYTHLTRYVNHFQSMALFFCIENEINAVKRVSNEHMMTRSKPSNDFVSQKGKTVGSCPPLEGAIDGHVVTRFPPEPSGYLHIGHAKACMLNHYYARLYHGKLIVRFDDTNPSKEKMEFEQSILHDLKKLDIVPDQVTYTSDSFELLIQYAKKLIEKGLAYMDNTAQEQMRQERMDGINSINRDTSIDTNLKLFEKLLVNDSSAANYCLRAKIDMQAKNKTLRDPVIFRVNEALHHRTGNRYKAYPTYDFACPIVDSVEGVTHALRTTEYNDRDAQYQWFLKVLELRLVKIHGFARMNFIYTVLSKRKLQWFVDHKYVEGWNDPRFPTVQGVLRRGVQVEALREFILSQGASRRITDMEWDKFWTLNKRVIDATARRYFAISKENQVDLILTNVVPSESEHLWKGIRVPRHPKDESMGNKIMRFGKHLIIEKEDAEHFQLHEEVTLMRYGNIQIQAIHRNAHTHAIERIEAIDYPQGDFKKTRYKIAWLANMSDLVPTQLIEFDHLITKAKLDENDAFEDFINPTTRAEMACLGDHEMRTLQKGAVIQLERRGYYCVDRIFLSEDKPLVLFMIPDGKTKAMSTLSTNLKHH